VEDWLPFDLADVGVDRVVKIYVVLKGKLKPARATTMDLAEVA
jgi:hypothetical protein